LNNISDEFKLKINNIKNDKQFIVDALNDFISNEEVLRNELIIQKKNSTSI
jgi:hypothetical protein